MGLLYLYTLYIVCVSPIIHRPYIYASLDDGTRSEKCAIRPSRRRVNVIECNYTNLDSIAYYTPRLYGIAYRS
jgi:hypothetical protein